MEYFEASAVKSRTGKAKRIKTRELNSRQSLTGCNIRYFTHVKGTSLNKIRRDMKHLTIVARAQPVGVDRRRRAGARVVAGDALTAFRLSVAR